MDISIKNRYETKGFHVCKAVVNSTLLDQTVSAVEEIAADYALLPSALQQKFVLLTDLSAQKFTEQQRAAVPAIPYIIGDLPALTTRFDDILLSPEIWQLTAEILGTAEIVYHFSNITTKPAKVGPRLNWHRDFPNQYICPRSSHFTRVLIALDAMDQRNGCTQLVQNSHQLTDEEARTAPKLNQLEISSATLLDIECQRGDIAFLHPKSIHGGGHNDSARHRRLLIMQFGPASEELVTHDSELFTGLTYQQMKEQSNARRTEGVARLQ